MNSKLYRSSTGCMLADVCAGLIYLLLWIMIPSSERARTLGNGVRS